jgi:hypothetical protein
MDIVSWSGWMDMLTAAEANTHRINPPLERSHVEKRRGSVHQVKGHAGRDSRARLQKRVDRWQAGIHLLFATCGFRRDLTSPVPDDDRREVSR